MVIRAKSVLSHNVTKPKNNHEKQYYITLRLLISLIWALLWLAYSSTICSTTASTCLSCLTVTCSLPSCITRVAKDKENSFKSFWIINCLDDDDDDDNDDHDHDDHDDDEDELNRVPNRFFSQFSKRQGTKRTGCVGGFKVSFMLQLDRTTEYGFDTKDTCVWGRLLKNNS